MADAISYEIFRQTLMAGSEVEAAYDAMANEFALAEALIAARGAAHLSQQQVAERMHTTQSAVARMESGRHAPSMASLKRYATAVGRTIKLEIHPEPAPPAA